MCLIFQENPGSRAYKLVAYKRKKCSRQVWIVASVFSKNAQNQSYETNLSLRTVGSWSDKAAPQCPWVGPIWPSTEVHWA